MFVFHLWNDFICTQCKAQSTFGLNYCLKSKSFLFRYLLHPFMVHKLFLKVMSPLYQPIGVRIWRLPWRNNYKTIIPKAEYDCASTEQGCSQEGWILHGFRTQIQTRCARYFLSSCILLTDVGINSSVFPLIEDNISHLSFRLIKYGKWYRNGLSQTEEIWFLPWCSDT